MNSSHLLPLLSLSGHFHPPGTLSESLLTCMLLPPPSPLTDSPRINPVVGATQGKELGMERKANRVEIRVPDRRKAEELCRRQTC